MRSEGEVRGRPPDTRLRARHDRTRPLVAALRTVLDEAMRQLSPKSEMAKAIVYGFKLWPALVRFLDDGRVSTAYRVDRLILGGRRARRI